LFDLFPTEAWAQAPGAGPPQSGMGMLFQFIPFILIFVLFYFLLIMPQQKKAKQRKQMIEALKKGDRVMTSGGILGTVVNLSAKEITLQVAEGTRIKFRREYIEEVIVTDIEGEDK
jgi:preprotein translocase subunit YajC